jgi:hypothetical protein
VRGATAEARGWEAVGVLRELRGSHGGPHLGTRLVALGLALLLAGPLSYVGFRFVAFVLHQVV